MSRDSLLPERAEERLQGLVTEKEHSFNLSQENFTSMESRVSRPEVELMEKKIADQDREREEILASIEEIELNRQRNENEMSKKITWLRKKVTFLENLLRAIEKEINLELDLLDLNKFVSSEDEADLERLMARTTRAIRERLDYLSKNKKADSSSSLDDSRIINFEKELLLNQEIIKAQDLKYRDLHEDYYKLLLSIEEHRELKEGEKDSDRQCKKESSYATPNLKKKWGKLVELVRKTNQAISLKNEKLSEQLNALDQLLPSVEARLDKATKTELMYCLSWIRENCLCEEIDLADSLSSHSEDEFEPEPCSIEATLISSLTRELEEYKAT